MKCAPVKSVRDFLKFAARIVSTVVFALLAAVAGCASYQPQPLTAARVEAALQPPGPAELQVLAREISHPFLRPVVLQPDQGLTPESAAVLAVLLNPGLRAARDQRQLAEAQLLAAGLLPNPELIYSLDVPTGGDTSGKVDAFGLGLNWEVTALISRAARVSAAKAGRKAVDLEIAWQEWQIAQAAKSAVYRLLSLQRQAALAEQAGREMARTLARIQAAVSAGSLTTDALRAARASELQARQQQLDLEQQADRQRRQLRRLLGLPEDRSIQLNRTIQLPSRLEPPAEQQLLDGLEQRRLDLLALKRGYNRQEEAVRAAILEQFPRISLGPTFSRDTDRLQTTGFSLSIELPLLNRQQGRIVRERATRQKLFDEYVNRVFEARSDIGLLLSGVGFLNRQLATAETAVSELDQLAVKDRAALQDGRTDLRSYENIWHELTAARLQLLALQGQLAQAVVGLQLASGCSELPQPLPAAAVKGQSP